MISRLGQILLFAATMSVWNGLVEGDEKNVPGEAPVFHAVWSQNLDDESAGEPPMVLAFEASWCSPCRQMSSVVSKLQREGHRIRRVDVDKEPKLARQFEISTLPAFVAVVGKNEHKRIHGIASEERLRQLFRSGSTPFNSGCSTRDCEETRPTETVVPAASRTVSLIRATYPIGKEKAEALLEFLKSHSHADLECELREDGLEITTTPQKQIGIGQFIQMFLESDTTNSSLRADAPAPCCVPVKCCRDEQASEE